MSNKIEDYSFVSYAKTSIGVTTQFCVILKSGFVPRPFVIHCFKKRGTTEVDPPPGQSSHRAKSEYAKGHHCEALFDQIYSSTKYSGDTHKTPKPHLPFLETSKTQFFLKKKHNFPPGKMS